MPLTDYRVSEEWMLAFSVKGLAGRNAAKRDERATTSRLNRLHPGEVGYHRIPLRKGPAVEKLAIMARIDDTPYRIIPVATVNEPIRTQISFLNASQRDGFESSLGPKQQSGMVNFDLQGPNRPALLLWKWGTSISRT